MLRRFKRILSLVLVVVLTMLFCSSCSTQTKEVERVKDLEYTVVEEADIPEELLSIINEKKQSPFKLTFVSTGKEYYYIVVGYGTQNTGGYSIQVEDLFLSTNAIYMNTNLIGPGKNEPVITVLTYPYIVVKTEYIDKKVVFQ